jgi:hypothetical protein
LILLPDKSLHGHVHLIDIQRYSRLGILGVIDLIDGYIPILSHVLPTTISLIPVRAIPFRGKYLNLICRPRVHAKRLDLGDVCSQLPV